MSNLFSSSIGKKLIMSLSGLFMMVFLVVHLVLNLTLLCDGGEAYNLAVHFMGTNPMIKVMEPVLAAGFLIHIIYAMVLTAKNMKARPVKYNQSQAGYSSTWASRNMFVLGAFVLAFLVVHMMNFYVKMKITGDPMLDKEVIIGGVAMHDAYTFVSSLFMTNIVYSIIYLISFVLLGFHLTHGFWSAFQTVGANNKIWYPRLKMIGQIYAVLIVIGYSIIPIYFMIK